MISMDFKSYKYWSRICVIFLIKSFFVSKFYLFSKDFNSLRNLTINTKKRLFILGTGSSIDAITEDQFKIMKLNNALTIGLNGWVYHKFIPDIYSLEFDTSGKSPEADRMIERAIILCSSLPKEKPIIFLKMKLGLSKIKKYAFNRCKNIYLYSHLRLDNSSPKKYYKSLLFLIGLLKKSKKTFLSNFLLGSGSSLERILSYGIISGFKEIIILGVDLEGPHFYDKSIISKQFIHKTNDRKFRDLTIEDMMKQYKTVAKKYGVKISVQSNTSPLAKFFPVFKW